jgi:putative nucleotidyltransferase with HDIG domain
LGARDRKSAAYKFLGMLYRETGQGVLAEARLRAALDLAREVGATADEAEAAREMAVLYQQLGRNQDALALLNSAHRLFGRVNAQRDLLDVGAKVAHLECIYLELVRQWGRSIESADTYTFGHCERVADYASLLAVALGLDGDQLKAVRLGAYLHDLGKVRVPHELLNKPGRLTAEELAVMQRHPVYGLELLAAVEFPWDIKPIIRWHHEKVDGSGYPDRLRGDEIPLHAQVICAADVFDALTTTRSYRGALPREQAIAEMTACRHWWRPEVFGAFLKAGLGAER